MIGQTIVINIVIIVDRQIFHNAKVDRIKRRHHDDAG